MISMTVVAVVVPQAPTRQRKPEKIKAFRCNSLPTCVAHPNSQISLHRLIDPT